MAIKGDVVRRVGQLQLQIDGENRALPLLRLQRHLAAHPLDQALCDGHAQIGALHLVGDGVSSRVNVSNMVAAYSSVMP